MIAGAAMFSGLSASQAQDVKGIEASSPLDATHIAEIENSVLEDKMPLKLQLKFLEQALQKGSTYSRELADMNLTPERLSQINKVANTVSARLTMKYADTPSDPEMKEYFSEADILRNATSQFKVPKQGGNVLCNKFAVREGVEVFEVTAFHCVQGSPYETDFYHPKRTEIAVKFMSKEDWTKLNGKDPEALPEVRPATTSEKSVGRVVAAFSYGRDGKAKTHFSVALPMPAKRTYIFNERELSAFSSMGMTEMGIFFKPYEEGLINPETKKTFSAGSSGGPVSAPGLGILGSYSATKQITDTCGKTCFAMGFFSGPDVLQRAIQEERGMRKGHVAEVSN
jgi:hypothetical protein